MKRTIIIALSTILLATPAIADHGHDKKDSHSHEHHNMAGHQAKSKTMPADGSVLEASPEHIAIKFGHEMTPESVVISTLAGDQIELNVGDVGKTHRVMVMVPKLQSDDYTVDWRARGEDGHVMSGAFSFTVK